MSIVGLFMSIVDEIGLFGQVGRNRMSESITEIVTERGLEVCRVEIFSMV